MNCSKCGNDEVRTTMTRQYKTHAVIRRKKCSKCNHAWYTMETQIPLESIIHKRTYEGRSTFGLAPEFQGMSYT